VNLDYPSHDQLVRIDWHTSGGLANGSGAARAGYYGVTATPDVFFDGADDVLGAGDSVSAYNTYSPIMAAHAATTSKTILSASYDLNSVTGMGSLIIDAEVAAGDTIATPDSCRIRAALYEDNITLCCEPRTGFSLWQHIGRMMITEKPFTISNSGETQQVTQVFSLNPAWDVDNLHVVAWVQRNTGTAPNKPVLQAAYARRQFDCALNDLDGAVATTNGAPGELDVELAYTGALDDDVILTLDKSSLPVGWDAELVWNATVYPTGVTIPAMTDAQTEALIVRVIPDGSPGLGTVHLDARPASNTSGAVGTVHTYHVFNQRPSILFVDDDTGASSEVQFDAAITGAGYFAVPLTVDVDGNPPATFMDDYDVVIWNTGELATQTIGANPQAEIEAYLNGGGTFFLTSQGYLNHRGLNTFTTNFLKVSAFTSNVGAPTVVGVPLDPIGDGLSFTLTPPFANNADAVTPGSGAFAWLTSGANNVAVRYDSGVFRTVFMTAPFEGLSAPDAALLTERVLDWLAPSTITDVNPPATAAAGRLELSPNAPNPFASRTTVRFAVPNAGPVSLVVYDVAGRKVADLVDRPLPAGAHAVEWDGRDRDGSRVASGVYLVRLSAGGETVSREMVRVK